MWQKLISFESPNPLILNRWLKFEPTVGSLATQLKFIKFASYVVSYEEWVRQVIAVDLDINIV